ncbi:S8 family peptidase [Algoriphagus chordae]|uniref:Subtilase family protein n=1 Tax=Algoriphagus chordae TaxID=237019 RepID=A0A2W7QF36_9BACT|nr:S8/S53 family peptidase [Algoriphagus chordae]PZX46853.1 subtilase family protein [Algoriphagus chordae]
MTNEKNNVLVELTRDEILTTNSSIEINVTRDADMDSVIKSIAVQGVDGKVTPTRKAGNFVWKPVNGIPPGKHQLTIEPIVNSKSKKLSDTIVIPFTVIATKSKVDNTVLIGSFVRLKLVENGVERLPNDKITDDGFIEFYKAIDRKKGMPISFEIDHNGRKVDGEKILENHRNKLNAKFGKLHPSLYSLITSNKPPKTVLVDIWQEIEEPEAQSTDRALNDCEQETSSKKDQEQRQEMLKRMEKFSKSLKGKLEIVKIDEIAPVVTAKVETASIRELIANKEVAGILLHETEGIEDLDNSIAIAESDVVHAGGERGYGVKVAVWEGGPASNANLVIAGKFKANPTSTSDHSQNVHAIIKNNESGTPDGHAPDCSLYSANDYDRDALTWAVKEKGCTVINQSFHRASEPGSGALSGDDIYGDYLAVRSPYPLIVHAAGNFWNGDPDNITPPSSEYVNHKGYNTISVGNHNDSASAMSNSSVFRNPTSSHGDRELPEIAANGMGVTADGITKSGTSMASPAVVGVSALLQGTNSTLKHWPEGCRAILLASATKNVEGNTWWQDVSNGVDAKDGAGAVNANEGRKIANNRRYRNAPATLRGWDIGLLSSSNFGNDKLSTFEYKVSVPNYFYGPRKVKVALAWTSKATKTSLLFFSWYMSQLKVDLDLIIYDENGAVVGYSGSWDNSYEIAEFTGQPGKTYTIKIRRWSGTDSTWFGIAWTVTGGMSFTLNPELLQTRRMLGDF